MAAAELTGGAAICGGRQSLVWPRLVCVHVGIGDPGLGRDPDLAALDPKRHLQRWLPLPREPPAYDAGAHTKHLGELNLGPFELVEPRLKERRGGQISHGRLIDQGQFLVKHQCRS